MITDEETQAAINKLKNGKDSDNNGIRAEDIKTCDNETKEMVKSKKAVLQKHAQSTDETKKKWMKKMSETIARFVLASAVQTVFDYLAQQTLSQA